MDQGGSLERLTGLLLGHLRSRQPSQLVVNQRQKLLGRLRIALLDGTEDSGDVGHACGFHIWAGAQDYSGPVTPQAPPVGVQQASRTITDFALVSARLLPVVGQLGGQNGDIPLNFYSTVM